MHMNQDSRLIFSGGFMNINDCVSFLYLPNLIFTHTVPAWKQQKLSKTPFSPLYRGGKIVIPWHALSGSIMVYWTD